MNNNLIDFSKFTANKQADINIEAAKKYFIGEVLPYVGENSLQRLIQADIANNPQFIRLEMMRMFVESQLMRTTPSDTNRIKDFFFKSDKIKFDPQNLNE
jgi:hypothetical protein